MKDNMKTLGIYIHLPFCVSKCLYCDFCSFADKDNLMDSYQSALISHLIECAPMLSDYYIDTVYFGGGTPSYYGAKRLIALFDTLKRNYKVMKASEVSLEANPDSVNAEELTKLTKSGFNRISLGVQSLNDATLKRIGRVHNSEQALDAVEIARNSGFRNISLDLICGLPGQSKSEWAETLNRALQSSPTHISVYMLEVKEGTPMWRSMPHPDDDTQADMYLYAVNTLAAAGYMQYEISNFARKGYECKHNLKYWLRRDYCGFGASAASYFSATNFKFEENVEKYINAVNSGENILIEREELSPYEQASEYLIFGMRTTRGICKSEYETIYRGGFAPLEEMLDAHIRRELVVKRDGRYSFTPQGFLLSNRLINELRDAQAERKSQVGSPWQDDDFYDTL